MVRGNGIDEHRRFVRARASTISSRCPICINENKDKITTIRPIAELHHIFGRVTRDPNNLCESIFGTIVLCNPHHQEYAPLLHIESYLRDMEHWDRLLDAYWSYIGLFNFLSEEESELRLKLLRMSNVEFIEFFLGERDGNRA